MRLSLARPLAIVTGTILIGCGSAAAPAPVPVATASASASSAPPVEYPLPAQRALSGESALDVMLERGVSTWTTIDVAVLRESPATETLAKFLPFHKSLTNAGVSPTRDFDRMLLVTHPSLTLVEHHVDDERVTRFLDRAFEDGGSAARRVEVDGRACVQLHTFFGEGTVCALAPGILVVTNERDTALWNRLAGARIPAPSNGEAARTEVIDERFFRERGKNSFRSGRMMVDVRPDRSLRVDARLTSDKAAEDHAMLSKLLGGLRDLHLTRPKEGNAPVLGFLRDLRVTRSNDGEVRISLILDQ